MKDKEDVENNYKEMKKDLTEALTFFIPIEIWLVIIVQTIKGLREQVPKFFEMFFTFVLVMAFASHLLFYMFFLYLCWDYKK